MLSARLLAQQESCSPAPLRWGLVTFLWPKTKTASLDAEIRVVCDDHGADCRVSLSGRITIDSSPDLRVLLLQRLQSPSCQTVTVDFCEVEYLDMSGLAVLVEVLKAARGQGKAFRLSGLRERPLYLLEALRLLHLFDEVNRERP
jgi:anti-anti-sigma factor